MDDEDLKMWAQMIWATVEYSGLTAAVATMNSFIEALDRERGTKVSA